MGSATIVESLGEGQYTVTLDYGSSEISARIASLEAKIVLLDVEISTWETNVIFAKAVAAQAYADLNAAIDAYAANPVESELNTVKELTAAANTQRVNVDKTQYKVDTLKAQKKDAELAIEYLATFDLQSEQAAWCVDYTLNAEGSVATIEIPGEPVAVVIAPECPVPVDATDGVVTARVVQDPNQLYLNLALLPGWQKFQPTYRVGSIFSIDRALDTCSVDLDDALSSAQNLDINQDSTLYDVPIEYMTCNSLAFAFDDRVVVKFENQNWENPKVIGFESNPKLCSVGVLRIAEVWPLAGPNSGMLTFAIEDEWGQDLLDKFRVITSVAVWRQSDLVVEMRPEGDIWYELELDSVTQAQDAGGTGTEPITWKYTASGQLGGSPDDDNFEVWLNDSTGDYYDWLVHYINNGVVYDSSYEMTQPMVFRILTAFDSFPDGDFSGWPEPSYEFRIRSTGYPVGDAIQYLHFAIRTADNGLYGVKDIDQITDKKYNSGSGIIVPMVLMTDYEFPPDP